MPSIGLRGSSSCMTAAFRITRITFRWPLIVCGEYVPALIFSAILTRHAATSACRSAPRIRGPKAGSRWCSRHCAHFTRPDADLMSPAFTLSSKSDAANALKVVVGACGSFAPSRTFFSSSCRSVNAAIASCPCTVNFTSLSFPVRQSTALPRTRKPPSFLRHTPGLLAFGAVHEFHLRTHFCSVIVLLLSEGTGASERECTAAEKGVEVRPRPHPCARAAAPAGRHDAALAHRLADGTPRLEAAVTRGARRRHVGRP